MKAVKTLILATGFIFSSTGHAKALNASNLSFKYQPNEDKAFSCTFEVENKHASFYKVKCPYYKTVKEFSVKISVRKFERKEKMRSKGIILLK